MASSFVNLYILQSDTAGAVQIAEGKPRFNF